MLTPGQNVKHYLAGAMDAKTGHVIWVKGDHKHSALFIELLRKLDRHYADKKVIHIILDNYIIHSSKITQRAVEKFNGSIVLHFLPPYCPEEWYYSGSARLKAEVGDISRDQYVII